MKNKPIDYLNTYTKRFYCGNCNHHFEKRFKKGIRATPGKCPNCGCPVDVHRKPTWGQA